MYYLWIQYDGKDKEDPIKYWYCQCKSGARMVGSCSHVACLLWFIGEQRHENDVSSQIILDNILLLRIFHLLVMNMIPLRIRLYCIFFLFQALN